MCGISGIFGAAPAGAVHKMVAAMRHRGPDDQGIFEDSAVSIGMARLSIIDISALGHQPMSNAAQTIWIVYNGETYNFREERALLEKQGETFRSSSDTEVVLRLYERYGDDFVTRLRGMFAAAIYDKRGGPGRERMLLVRDHLGIKPLYYATPGGRLVFASEIKAMLASGLVPREIDPVALRQSLTFGSVQQPRSILSGVSMLPPGHRLVRERGRNRIERYWSLGTGRHPDLMTAPPGEQEERLTAALEESVRLQMVSDVSLGAFLSGGVDSSLLTALMSRITGRPVKTFSVGYRAEGVQMDETEDAGRIARFIGSDHSRVEIQGSEVADRILHMAWGLDQPTVDGANSYFVSLAARRAVTVSISGTGGDELFAGYPWFIAMNEWSRGAAGHPLLALAQSAAAKLARWTPLDRLVAGRGGSRLQRLRERGDFLSVYGAQYRIYDPRSAAGMLAASLRGPAGAGGSPVTELAGQDELPGANPIDRVSALCLRGYTLNQLLRDIDAASMAHSLEVRVPLLDPVLADLALSLPPGAKLGAGTRPSAGEAGSYAETGAKKILVDLARKHRLLPEGMADQPKRGFGMPFGHWMRHELRPVLEDALSPSAVRSRGFFDPAEATRLRGNLLAGREGWARPWLLMMTELWARTVFDGKGPV